MAERYLVKSGLTYAGDAKTEAALLAAATRPEAERGAAYAALAGRMKAAAPGDIVNDLPARSIPWLLEQGHIAAPPATTEVIAAPAPITEAIWGDLGRPEGE